jgi:hypothetical protein
MAIAKDYILLGISMKKIAKKRKTSYYHVRSTLKHIEQFLGEARVSQDKEH